jgi:hypothetical protein
LVLMAGMGTALGIQVMATAGGDADSQQPHLPRPVLDALGKSKTNQPLNPFNGAVVVQAKHALHLRRPKLSETALAAHFMEHFFVGHVQSSYISANSSSHGKNVSVGACMT